ICFIITFLFSVFFAKAQIDTFTLSEQAQSELIDEAMNEEEPNVRITFLAYLINSGKITDEENIAQMYVAMAEAKAENLEDCGDEKSMNDTCKALYDEILALYAKANKACEFCIPRNLLSKYETLGGYNYYSEEQTEEDLKQLKSYG